MCLEIGIGALGSTTRCGPFPLAEEAVDCYYVFISAIHHLGSVASSDFLIHATVASVSPLQRISTGFQHSWCYDPRLEMERGKRKFEFLLLMLLKMCVRWLIQWRSYIRNSATVKRLLIGMASGSSSTGFSPTGSRLTVATCELRLADGRVPRNLIPNERLLPCDSPNHRLANQTVRRDDGVTGWNRQPCKKRSLECLPNVTCTHEDFPFRLRCHYILFSGEDCRVATVEPWWGSLVGVCNHGAIWAGFCFFIWPPFFSWFKFKPEWVIMINASRPRKHRNRISTSQKPQIQHMLL